MINKKEDLIGTIFNVANDEGDGNVRLAGMFYDVCTKYEIRVMGGNGRDFFMKAVGGGLVNLCIADDGGLVAFGRTSVSKNSEYGARGHSMSGFRNIDESELKAHLEEPVPQPKEVEWVNGDDVEYFHPVFEWTAGGRYVCLDHGTDCHVFADKVGNLDYAESFQIRKPESPEDKANREREENGKSLYELVQRLWVDIDGNYSPCPHESPVVTSSVKEMYARLAEKLDYRCTTSS